MSKNNHALRLVETFNSCTFFHRDKLLTPAIAFWMKWSPITVIRTSLVQRYYATTFPVYQDYLTSKHSQLTYCRSNASQSDRPTPVLELTLVEYTFGYKTTNKLSEKERFNLGGYWAPYSCQWPVASFSDVLPPGSIVYLRHCLQLWVTRGETVANFSCGTFCVKHQRVTDATPFVTCAAPIVLIDIAHFICGNWPVASLMNKPVAHTRFARW